MAQTATNHVVTVWIMKLVITWTEAVQTAAQRDGKMMSAKKVSIYDSFNNRIGESKCSFYILYWSMTFELYFKKNHSNPFLRQKNWNGKKNCFRTLRCFAPSCTFPISFVQSVIRVTLDWCVRMNAVSIAWILYLVITWQGHVTADVKMAG